MSALGSLGVPGFFAACATCGRGSPGAPRWSREKPRPARRGPLFAKLDILGQLGITIGDAFASVAHPKTDDVLRRAQIAQAGDAVAPEAMEAGDTVFLQPSRCSAQMHGATRSTLKQECTWLNVLFCDERDDRRIQSRLQINYPISSLGLYAVLFLATYIDAPHRDRGVASSQRVWSSVPANVNAQGFRDAKARPAEHRIQQLVIRSSKVRAA